MFMPTPRTFEKVNGSDKSKHVFKKLVKNATTKNIVKTPFWGTSKNRRLDPKVCSDMSWLLVIKNGLKKCYINNNMTDKLQQQEEYGSGLILAIFFTGPP